MKKKFPILMITLLLSSAVSLSTRAASPEFARTPEEWAVLRDNTLSWEEIPDLVNEYNATVLANVANMSSDGERLRDAAHTNADLSDMADQYEVMAAEAEGMTGGALQAASFRMMADQLRSQASENTSDYRVLCVEYDGRFM